VGGSRVEMPTFPDEAPKRMKIDSARATPLPNNHLHSPGPMSSFVVCYPGLTRRCLTGPSRYQAEVGIAFSRCAAALCRHQRLYGGRCTCQDYQRPPLRLVSAVARDQPWSPAGNSTVSLAMHAVTSAFAISIQRLLLTM
jgi:hypothetical protein